MYPMGFLLRRRWHKHLLDMIEQNGDLPIMLRHLTRQFLVGGKHLAEFHERSHDSDVHLNGPCCAELRRASLRPAR
jgi:hypothetical protein